MAILFFFFLLNISQEVNIYINICNFLNIFYIELISINVKYYFSSN